MARNDAPPKPDRADAPILFFDGVCALCNGFVDFLVARDKRARLRFSALQGETFAARVGRSDPAPAEDDARAGEATIGDGDWMRSLVVLDANGIHRKSDGVIILFQALGGIWSLAAAGWLVPRFLRDFLYDILARNRYRWFGKRETCRLPTAAERGRFLP